MNYFSRGTLLLTVAWGMSIGNLGAACAPVIAAFDVPGSTSTTPMGINGGGLIAGYYVAGTKHGFIRDSAGNFVTFDVLGATSTSPAAINSAGTVAGYYSDGVQNHGFIRTSAGAFTLFDPVGSVSTTPTSINDSGVVTGYYSDGGQTRGFVRDSGGSITTFDPAGSTFTQPWSINNNGEIAGSFLSGGVFHGFVRSSGGAITSFDVPGATSTTASSINGSGDITGTFVDGLGSHGYIRSSGGAFTFFDAQPGGTSPASINSGGVTTGSAGSNGWVRDSTGAITLFSVAGFFGTSPVAINSSEVVTGTVLGSGEREHGFVRYCAAEETYQLKYFNINYGSGQIIVSNAGSMSTGNNPADDSSGTVCANFYSFDPNEEMQTCCSCPVTPNGLASLNVNEDIVAQNLIVNPSTAITVKLVFTQKSLQNAGGLCDPSKASAGALARGGLAWGTNLRNVTFQGSPPTANHAVTETRFARAELSAAELNKLTTYCAYIKILGSSVSGICKSCQAGARGSIGR